MLTYTKCTGVDFVLKNFLAEKNGGEGFQVTEMHFSSPGRSLGRAIVLPPASALALASAAA